MQRRPSGAQGLVFGGLMAALFVVFSLVPVLSVFMPIPLVLAYVRYGGRLAVMTGVIATLFTMAFTGFVTGLLVIPGGILPALVFGHGFRHKWRPLTIGIVAVVVFFLGYAMEYGITRVAMFEGRDPIQAALESPAGRDQLERTAALMEKLVTPSVPNPTPQQELALQQSRELVESFRRDPVGLTWSFLPTSLFILGAISTWINYMLCRVTLPRFGHEVPKPGSFAEFRMPVSLIWAYGILIFAIPVVFTTDLVGASWWVKLLLNVFTPLGLIIVLAGLAVVYGFLRKKNYSKGVSIAFALLTLVMLGQLSTMILMLVAMWDSIFDFRGLGHGIRKRPEEGT